MSLCNNAPACAAPVMRVGNVDHHIPMRAESTLDEVKLVLKGLFGWDPATVKLSYVDEDGDSISICSTPEWHYAVAYLHEKKAPENVVLVEGGCPKIEAEIEVNLIAPSAPKVEPAAACDTATDTGFVMIETVDECGAPVVPGRVINGVPASSAEEAKADLTSISLGDPEPQAAPSAAIESKTAAPDATAPLNTVIFTNSKAYAMEKGDTATTNNNNVSTNTDAKAKTQQPPSEVATRHFRQAHAALCDRCNSRVIGFRYKCTVCPDFDFCETCYGEFYNARNDTMHDSSHTFRVIKLGYGACSRHSNRHFLQKRSPPKKVPCSQTKCESPALPRLVSSPLPAKKLSRHYNIICNHCRTANLVGNRWKCAQCRDYDLCDACYSQFLAQTVSPTADNVAEACPVHRADHAFIQIREPATRSTLGSFVPVNNFYHEEPKSSGDVQRNLVTSIRCAINSMRLNAKEEERKTVDKLKQEHATAIRLMREDLVRLEKRTAEAEKEQAERRAAKHAEEERMAAEKAIELAVEQERRAAEKAAEQERLAAEAMAKAKEAVEQAARKDAEREQEARKKYSRELQVLSEMGFTDDLRNLTLLYRHDDVMKVLQQLME